MTATIERPTMRRVASMGPVIADWIEANCSFTKGRWIGEPFRLLPWQRQLLSEMFEMERNDAGEWTRRYREALINIPKKNGKTELIAAVGLWFLLEDPEPAPEIYCAANSEEQADLVFGSAKTMCEVERFNDGTPNPLRKRTQVWKDTITSPERPGAKLVRVAAATGTNDGKNVYIAIFDELHEFTDTKGRGLYNVLTNGQAARQQPMSISITTAGYDMETLWGEKYEFGRRVASGEVQAPFYFKSYEAPAGLDWRDERAWEIANPSYGVTVMPEFYRERIRNNIPQSQFERFYLDRITESEETWLPAGTWDGLAVPPFEFDAAEPLWAAIDVSHAHDATAVVSAQWRGDRLYTQCRMWERPIDPYTGYAVTGWTIPRAEVEQYLRSLSSTYDVWSMPFDPRPYWETFQSLEQDGVPVYEFPQHTSRMGPAYQMLYSLITEGRLAHDGDPQYARHIAAAVKKPIAGTEDGWTLKKGAKRKHIDAAVALAMVAYAATKRIRVGEEEVTGPTFWDFGDAE